MEWNVFYYNINARQIQTYNIFNHYRFNEDVLEDLKKCKDKEEFAHTIKLDLMYYFGHKAEWEVLVSYWIGDAKEAIKIDACKQVMNNFDVFVDYVWNRRNQ